MAGSYLNTPGLNRFWDNINSILKGKMANDGSNYQGDIPVATPIINCIINIKDVNDNIVSTIVDKSVDVEKGAVVEFSGSYKYTLDNNHKAPTSCSGNWVELVKPNESSIIVKDPSIISSKTFSVTLKAPKSGLEVKNSKVVRATGEDSVTSSINIRVLDRIFYGVSESSSEDITKLSTELVSSKSKSLKFNCSGGLYFYYAIPSEFGDINMVLNGLAFTGYTVTTQVVTNQYGANVEYKVYRSTSVQTGDNIQVTIS